MQAASPDKPLVLTTQQTIVVVLLALVLLGVIVELVRKRKLREEYALLWIGTGTVLLVMAIWTDLLKWFQKLVGAEQPASALWFGALLFLMLVMLQFSIRISKMAFREKALAQRVALLEKELDDMRRQLGVRDEIVPPSEYEAPTAKAHAAGRDG